MCSMELPFRWKQRKLLKKMYDIYIHLYDVIAYSITSILTNLCYSFFIRIFLREHWFYWEKKCKMFEFYGFVCSGHVTYHIWL